mgnify:CR=1 FL=1
MPNMPSSRSWFRAAIFVGLAVAVAGVSYLARYSKTNPVEFSKLDQESLVIRFSAWDDQCRAGTFDIREVRIREVQGIDSPWTKQFFACVSLASHQPASSKTSGSPPGDKDSQQLAVMAAAIQGMIAGHENPENDPCRWASSVSGNSVSSMEIRRCRLLHSVIQQRQGSGVLCKKAREMGVVDKDFADKDFGCSPDMSFIDGRPDRCGDGWDSVECRELAGLVAALRSKEPKDCAASPFCKVLSSRDVRACEPYLKQANKACCDGISSLTAKLKQRELVREAEAAKKQEQRSFKKGEPMLEISPTVLKRMKEIEEASVPTAARQKQLEQERQADIEKPLARDAKEKRIFKKGEPMENIPPDVQKRMKEIEAAGQTGK